MVEAIREVTVGVEEVGSGDEEDEPVIDYFRSVDYNPVPASHSGTSPRMMESHDPSCHHPQEEEEEDYFSMKHEIVRPRLDPLPNLPRSEPPKKSTATPPTKPTVIPIPITIKARTGSEPTRFGSPIDSFLEKDLSETHFRFHRLKRYTDAELQKELKKDSGAGFESGDESENEGERFSREARLLEIPGPQPLSVVGGYFDF